PRQISLNPRGTIMKSATNSPVIAEILAGDGLSLAEAARVVPAFRSGKPTHTATLWRWAAKGVRLRDGTVVRLETCRIGGRQMTSRAALGRFIAAQTWPCSLPTEPPRARQSETAKAASEELN